MYHPSFMDEIHGPEGPLVVFVTALLEESCWLAAFTVCSGVRARR
jgi:hypothetical protein